MKIQMISCLKYENLVLGIFIDHYYLFIVENIITNLPCGIRGITMSLCKIMNIQDDELIF